MYFCHVPLTPPPPFPSYLGPSLDLYRAQLGPATIFIYVSDEPAWGRKYLAKHRSVPES